MNELTVFRSEEFGEIRTIFIDGEIWFVGKDVTSALGYVNHSKALSDHVDSEDKLMLKFNNKVYKKSSKSLNICGFAQIFCLHFN